MPVKQTNDMSTEETDPNLLFNQWKWAWDESAVDFPGVFVGVCTARLWVPLSPKQKQNKWKNELK